jgi:hypothetical protein
VLNSLSEQIRECLKHAQDCAHKAAAHPDGSALRNHFVAMEQRWLGLARNIEFGERLDRFTTNREKANHAKIESGGYASGWPG